MAIVPGKSATLYVGLSSPATVKVAKAKEPTFDRSPTKADTTTNDSGLGSEHEVVRVDGDCAIKCVTDKDDPGQIILRNAARNGTKIFAEYREYGDGSTLPGERFQCSVTMKRSSGVNDYAMSDFTLSPSGAVTTVTQ
jgi:hypothetical protein